MTSDARVAAPRGASAKRAAATTAPAGKIAARSSIETPDGTFEFSPHNCFACGTLNSGGLRLALHVGAGRSWTDVALDPRFEGWEGVVHGGIVSTILDEVMAWALVGEDNWGVTARMAIQFRHPVRVGVPIHAEGWITRSRRRIVDTAARIVDDSGNELATATGVYVAADPARKRDLQERYAFGVAEDASAATPRDNEIAGRPADRPPWPGRSAPLANGSPAAGTRP